MEKRRCRACLIEEKHMTPLDEFFVKNYNFITNLDIKLGDRMPQYLCKNCVYVVRLFVEFREKSISSEVKLREIVKKNESMIKVEVCDNRNNELTSCNKVADDTKKISEELKNANNRPKKYNLQSRDNLFFNAKGMQIYSNNKLIEALNTTNQSLLPCGLCDMVFKKRKHLSSHLESHKEYCTCELCPEVFGSWPQLFSHRFFHLPQQERQCHICTIKFESATKLEYHYVNSHCYTEFTEDIDNNLNLVGKSNDIIDTFKKEIKIEQFEEYMPSDDYNDELDHHIRLSVKDIKSKKKKQIKPKNKEEAIFNCGLCKSNFQDKNELVKHLENHKKYTTCDVCRDSFSDWTKLLSHRLVHLPGKQRRCHLCDKRFASPLYMEFHYITLHNEGQEKTLSCSQCNGIYTTPRKLQKHMHNVHSPPKYICDYCSKRFTTKTFLSNHMRRHTKVKSYVCDLCGFSCKYSSNLKDHKIRRHTPSKVTCYQCQRVFNDQEQHDRHKCKEKGRVCPICGMQLATTVKLSRHLIKHDTVGKFKCDRCPATYKHLTALKCHIDKHDGNRTKQCNYCPAKFYSSSVLIKHHRIHTGEKPYVCKVCHKGFTGNNNLKVHMKTHGEYIIMKKTVKTENNAYLVNL